MQTVWLLTNQSAYTVGKNANMWDYLDREGALTPSTEKLIAVTEALSLNTFMQAKHGFSVFIKGHDKFFTKHNIMSYCLLHYWRTTEVYREKRIDILCQNVSNMSCKPNQHTLIFFMTNFQYYVKSIYTYILYDKFPTLCKINVNLYSA